MSNLAVVCNVPGYLCSFQSEDVALQLCLTLAKIGIAAKVRVQIEDNRPYGQPFRVWLNNREDYPKAVEFKRGLRSALGIKGDPSAFAEGILFGASIRGHREIPKLMEGQRALTAGSGENTEERHG